MKYYPPVLKNEDEIFNSVTYTSHYGLDFQNVKENKTSSTYFSDYNLKHACVAFANFCVLGILDLNTYSAFSICEMHSAMSSRECSAFVALISPY